jgi:hypothetical protein
MKVSGFVNIAAASSHELTVIHSFKTSEFESYKYFSGFNKRALRTMFRAKKEGIIRGWTKIHNEEQYKFCSSRAHTHTHAHAHARARARAHTHTHTDRHIYIYMGHAVA